MKPPVLLCYNLQGDKAGKIKLTAMRFSIRIRVVNAEEYTQSIAALCGLEPMTEERYEGEGFTDEMLVLANFPNSLASQFLQAFRRGKIPPVALKAMLTPTNAQWSSLTLHGELSQENKAFEEKAPPIHAEGQK